jgi:hypothetical protein
VENAHDITDSTLMTMQGILSVPVHAFWVWRAHQREWRIKESSPALQLYGLNIQMIILMLFDNNKLNCIIAKYATFLCT